jgi:hypothetical protein
MNGIRSFTMARTFLKTEFSDGDITRLEMWNHESEPMLCIRLEEYTDSVDHLLITRAELTTVLNEINRLAVLGE